MILKCTGVKQNSNCCGFITTTVIGLFDVGRCVDLQWLKHSKH
jgi:hypothetical protein